MGEFEQQRGGAVSTEAFEALKARVEQLEAAVAALQSGSAGGKRKAPPPPAQEAEEPVESKSTAPAAKRMSSGGPPRGRPPKDKMWDYERQEYVAAGSLVSPKPEALEESGGYKRPVGRPPAGKVWDAVSGRYVDAGIPERLD